MPDENPVAVAKVIKTFFFVETASPHTQHVLVSLRRGTDQFFQLCIGNAGRERIRWNPVGAFGENGQPVDDKREGTSPLVFLLAQFERAQADLKIFSVQDGIRLPQLNPNAIERLRSISIGLPQLRIFNLNY